MISYLWSLPSYHAGNRLARTGLSGWAASGVTTFQSGKPLTFTDARNGTAYGTASRAQFAPGMGNANIINKKGGTMLARIKNNTYLNPSASLFVTAPAVLSLPRQNGGRKTLFRNHSGATVVDGGNLLRLDRVFGVRHETDIYSA